MPRQGIPAAHLLVAVHALGRLFVLCVAGRRPLVSREAAVPPICGVVQLAVEQPGFGRLAFGLDFFCYLNILFDRRRRCTGLWWCW